MRCSAIGLAVPAAVGHLLPQQVLRQGLQARVGVAEVRQDGEHHAGDAGLAVLERGEPVDAAVMIQAAREQQLAAPQRLGIPSRQTQEAQCEQGVGRRDPLGAVQPAAPLSIGSLERQQPRTPACLCDTRLLGGDHSRGRIQQVTVNLPADGGVALQQPVEDFSIDRHD